jgi:hypothetical protein
MYFEYNIFDAYDNTAPSTHGVAFDYKLKGGLMRGNTIRNSPNPGQARLQSRFGDDLRVVRNHVDSTMFFVNDGTEGIIACNVADRIRVAAGNETYMFDGSGYQAANNHTYVSNDAPMTVGFEYGTWPYAANNTLIEDHTGAITCDNETNTDGACGDAANPTPSYTCDIAVPLNDNEVGQLGLAGAASAYLTPRGW